MRFMPRTKSPKRRSDLGSHSGGAVRLLQNPEGGETIVEIWEGRLFAFAQTGDCFLEENG